jgi:murein DD-endopeptidase MepM/ murein hydrolase activator NlpD
MNNWLAALILALVVSVAGAATADPLVLRGEAVQGGVLFGTTLPGSRVLQDGAPIRVGPEGEFVVGFGRDAPSTSSLRVERPDGEVIEQTLDVATRDYRIQRIDGLPPGKVTPRKPEEIARIRKDVADVVAARSLDDDRLDFLGGFIWPVEGPITGVYGSQRILNGEPRRPHFGIDIAAPVGTPVRAPAAGVVTLVVPDMFFSGGTLILDHGHKVSSTFLHLHRMHVKVGDRVEQGDVIAEVGATGRVTGPHLDWRMNVRKARVDPQLLVPPMPEVAAADGPG